MDDPRFPGAPPGSYISPEGWLVFGQESWTVEDWLRFPAMRPGYNHKGRAYASEEERQEAKLESRRRWRESRHRKANDAEMRRSA